MTKTCKNCLIEKDADEFYNKRLVCKECVISSVGVHSRENKEKIKEYKKGHREKNKDTIKKKKKIYYQENKEHLKEKSKKNYSLNKTGKLKYQKEYGKSYKPKRNENERNRKETDNLYRLRCAMSSMVYTAFKRKGYSKKSRNHRLFL